MRTRFIMELIFLMISSLLLFLLKECLQTGEKWKLKFLNVKLPADIGKGPYRQVILFQIITMGALDPCVCTWAIRSLAPQRHDKFAAPPTRIYPKLLKKSCSEIQEDMSLGCTNPPLGLHIISASI